jgi:hypothetical protein
VQITGKNAAIVKIKRPYYRLVKMSDRYLSDSAFRQQVFQKNEEFHKS